jgi:hypothetical protein
MAWKLIASALLTLAASHAEARQAALVSGNVIIRFRHPAMICAGVCPNYQIAIFANGDVVRGNPAAQATDWHHIHSNAVISFHVLPAKLRQFRSELDVLRPHGNAALDAVCNQTRLPDGSPDPISTAQPDDVEVRWIEGGHTDRLMSCAYGPLRAELESALRRLGIDPYSGKQLAPG